MALLEVNNIEAAYGAVQALRGVSLKVEQGQIVALLGANGAGKTTVLKAISGIVEPRQGSVSLEGRDLAGIEPDKLVSLGLSHVPEGREIFRMRTVHENLVLGAYLRKDHAVIQADLARIFTYFPILRERQQQRAGLHRRHPSHPQVDRQEPDRAVQHGDRHPEPHHARRQARRRWRCRARAGDLIAYQRQRWTAERDRSYAGRG